MSRAPSSPMVKAIAAFFAVSLALVGACAQANNDCEHNSDCSSGYCFRASADDAQGECKEDCIDAARDCPSGFVCNVNAQCEAAPDDWQSGGGAGGTGHGGSASTSSGGAGSTGNGGAGGVGAGGATGNGGASSTSQSTSSTGSTSTSASQSTSTSTSTTGGGGKGKLLDLCGGDGDCASGLLCRPENMGGSLRCTEPCGSDGDCHVASARCETILGSTYCARSDVGRPCSAGTDCNFACTPSQPGYCTARCQSGSDCPNGYGCTNVGGIKACVKAAAHCSTYPGDVGTAACIVPAACDESSPSLLVGGCTLACNTSNDCPRRAAGFAAWSCNQGICQRPADVAGPLAGGEPAEYYCNGANQVVNLCSDAQHIDFDTFNIPGAPSVDCSSGMSSPGYPGDSCVDSCRYQGGCAFGYTCTALAGLNATTRIGLCLPSGWGEVGASCQKDRDCAFSYCMTNGKCSRDCTDDNLCPTGSACTPYGVETVEGTPFKRCE